MCSHKETFVDILRYLGLTEDNNDHTLCSMKTFCSQEWLILLGRFVSEFIYISYFAMQTTQVKSCAYWRASSSYFTKYPEKLLKIYFCVLEDISPSLFFCSKLHFEWPHCIARVKFVDPSTSNSYTSEPRWIMMPKHTPVTPQTKLKPRLKLGPASAPGKLLTLHCSQRNSTRGRLMPPTSRVQLPDCLFCNNVSYFQQHDKSPEQWHSYIWFSFSFATLLKAFKNIFIIY